LLRAGPIYAAVGESMLAAEARLGCWKHSWRRPNKKEGRALNNWAGLYIQNETPIFHVNECGPQT